MVIKIKCFSVKFSMNEVKTKFKIGQIIKHKLFDYTGVIFDIDPEYEGTEE